MDNFIALSVFFQVFQEFFFDSAVFKRRVVTFTPLEKTAAAPLEKFFLMGQKTKLSNGVYREQTDC